MSNLGSEPLIDILPPTARPPSPVDPTPITIKRGNTVTTFDPLSFAATEDDLPSTRVPTRGSYQMAPTPVTSYTPSLSTLPKLPVIPPPSLPTLPKLPVIPPPPVTPRSTVTPVTLPLPPSRSSQLPPVTRPPVTRVPSTTSSATRSPLLPTSPVPVSPVPVKIEDATPYPPVNEDNFHDTTTPVNATRDRTPPYMYNQTMVKSPMIKVLSNSPVSPVSPALPPPHRSPTSLPEPSPPQSSMIINKLAARQRLSPTEKQHLIEYLERNHDEEDDEPAEDATLPYYMRIPDYGRLPIKAQLAVRDDFLRKFEQLRGPPFNFKIGEIDPQMSLEAMHISYNSFIRVFNRNYEVDQYFMGLFLMWAGIEAIASVFNFPIKGYTLFQLKRYETYRTLLNGLGETYDDNGALVIKRGWAEDYSPLTKIFIMSLSNIVFFVLFMFIRKINGEKNAELMIDELANKFYGSGEIKPVEKVVNEVINGPAGTRAGSGGFDFGSLVSSVAGSGALTNIGSLISNLFGGGAKEEPQPQVSEVALPPSPLPRKTGTYDDVVPPHLSPHHREKRDILTPGELGINNTHESPRQSSFRDRFRPRF